LARRGTAGEYAESAGEGTVKHVFVKVAECLPRMMGAFGLWRRRDTWQRAAVHMGKKAIRWMEVDEERRGGAREKKILLRKKARSTTRGFGVMLPGKDGFAVRGNCATRRTIFPIMMLTDGEGGTRSY